MKKLRGEYESVVILLYTKYGYTMSEIEKLLNVGKGQLTKVLKRNEIMARGRGERVNRVPFSAFAEEDVRTVNRYRELIYFLYDIPLESLSIPKLKKVMKKLSGVKKFDYDTRVRLLGYGIRVLRSRGITDREIADDTNISYTEVQVLGEDFYKLWGNRKLEKIHSVGEFQEEDLRALLHSLSRVTEEKIDLLLLKKKKDAWISSSKQYQEFTVKELKKRGYTESRIVKELGVSSVRISRLLKTK